MAAIKNLVNHRLQIIIDFTISPYRGVTSSWRHDAAGMKNSFSLFRLCTKQQRSRLLSRVGVWGVNEDRVGSPYVAK